MGAKRVRNQTSPVKQPGLRIMEIREESKAHQKMPIKTHWDESCWYCTVKLCSLQNLPTCRINCFTFIDAELGVTKEAELEFAL